MSRVRSRLRVLSVAVAWVVACPHARAATPWPEQAEGRYLPRPSWILVVPARRSPDGSLSIWDREDPWTMAWRVPRTVDGLRVVTLFGDSEDRRAITAKAIDGMMIDSLEVVRRKYGAPAIALAVSDGDRAEVAGWVRGYPASWTSVGGGDPGETRERMVATLSRMLGSKGRGVDASATDADARATDADDARTAGEPKAAGDLAAGTAATEGPVTASAGVPQAPVVGGDSGGTATVTAYRPREDGTTDYRIRARYGRTGEEAIDELRRLGPSAVVTVVDGSGPDVGVVVTTDMDRPALDLALRTAGFEVR